MDKAPSRRTSLVALFASGSVLLALALGGCLPAEQPNEEQTSDSGVSGGQAGSQVAVSFSASSERTLASNYLLFLPRAYGEDAQKTWPLILHLHGGGGRGTDPERLRGYPLVKRLEEEPDFPFVVVTPQCPPGRPGPLGDLWTEHAELVLAILDEVVANHRIDEQRIYLIGHSMGGNGAWYLAHRAPERFAAIAPMAAPAVTWWAYRIAEAGIPVWAFHGARDEAVPSVESERMVEALRAAGGDARLTLYPEGGHAIFEPFEGDELFEWLLAQRRKPVEEAPDH